jgi:2-desacetyl-2-hydroxyethyl bacteriochlorophyllide A dehydrogenase
MRALYFTAPRQIEIREEPLLQPNPEQLLIETLFSAISPGTEMLIYRGEAPQDLEADENITSLTGDLRYPLKYGYASVGRIASAGSPALAGWVDRLIFAFQPHQTHYLATPDQVIPLPVGISPEQALFLPNMETAVNFVMDGQPLIGERVAVFGQGIVGLLTTALLAKFPLQRLATFDLFPLRSEASIAAGAHESHNPKSSEIFEDFRSFFDLTYELTGTPATLNEAITVTGFDGRVVIGSWYGEKPAAINLGKHFHRSRIRLLSSQVSTLGPQFSGRWDKPRRFKVAWDMIRRIQPEKWITQRIAFENAEEAYLTMDSKPQETIQPILTYR